MSEAIIASTRKPSVCAHKVRGSPSHLATCPRYVPASQIRSCVQTAMDLRAWLLAAKRPSAFTSMLKSTYVECTGTRIFNPGREHELPRSTSIALTAY
eukprot:5301498-Pleurochrysis_carterae.AAC.1